MYLCSFSETPAYGSNIIYSCYKPQKTLKRVFWYINVPPVFDNIIQSYLFLFHILNLSFSVLVFS